MAKPVTFAALKVGDCFRIMRTIEGGVATQFASTEVFQKIEPVLVTKEGGKAVPQNQMKREARRVSADGNGLLTTELERIAFEPATPVILVTIQFSDSPRMGLN